MRGGRKSRMAKEEIIERYKKAANKLILLDYDGTLVDFVSLPERAVPQERLLCILTSLLNTPQAKVVVITGRSQQDIDRLLGHLPIDIVAEHGAIAKEKGEWKRQINDSVSWKKPVLPALNQITLACPNSFIEEKLFSITWHYRGAEKESGYAHSRQLIRLLENIASSSDIKVLDGNKVVEVTAKDIHKGLAAKKIVEQRNYDHILSIGDDATDEEMFVFLSDHPRAETIKVGEGKTSARHRLKNVNEVLSFLEQLLQ